jgi:hydroxypyruvate isomerase
MDRRDFVGAAALGAAAVAFGGRVAEGQGTGNHANGPVKFQLHYAPHPGMFSAHAGDDLLDQIRFAADQGFTAWEDNGLPSRTEAEQESIGKLLAELGMKMGVFVAYGSFDEPIFVRPNHPKRDEFLARMKQSVAIAKRVNATYMTVVPGSVDQQHQADAWNKYGGPRVTDSMGTAHAIELLRRGAEILEPDRLVMVLEPLNWKTDHGGVFLSATDQAYAICKAVNSPSCKILYDMYHEQITAGNIIRTMDACWDEIAYLQSGDNPGRKEPGTGEMNYRNIFRHLASRNRDLIIGMEHGNSLPGKEGELALIEAYRQADQFEV